MLHLDRLVSAPRAPINEPQKAKLEIYFRETKSRSKSDLAAMPCMDFTTWDPKIIGCNDLEIISNLISNLKIAKYPHGRLFSTYWRYERLESSEI